MELNSVIEFDKQNSAFTLIESNTDGSFLVHYLLSSCIRQSSAKTFLISLSQTFSHFKSVQAKLGNLSQLNSSLTNGNFLNFDLLTKLGTEIYAPKTNVFDEIFCKIQSIVNDCEEKYEKFNIIIDDLSIASLTGFTDNNLLEFLTKLQLLSNKVAIIAYIQSFYTNKYFARDLVHLSDLFFKVENLSTGYSKEIDGQVRLIKLAKQFF